jgi:hypothetical protein
VEDEDGQGGTVVGQKVDTTLQTAAAADVFNAFVKGCHTLASHRDHTIITFTTCLFIFSRLHEDP